MAEQPGPRDQIVRTRDAERASLAASGGVRERDRSLTEKIPRSVPRDHWQAKSYRFVSASRICSSSTS